MRQLPPLVLQLDIMNTIDAAITAVTNNFFTMTHVFYVMGKCKKKAGYNFSFLTN
jgi:hypothetical protein